MSGAEINPPPPVDRRSLGLDTVSLGHRLVGCVLVRAHRLGLMTARIVETEAYPPGDAASHAFRGRTPRCGAMFLGPGHAYVYIAYGTALMLNVSAEPEGTGAAVLIRAVEPLIGIEIMKQLRHTSNAYDLTRGPGRLTQALGIDRSLDGIDLTETGPLWLAEAPQGNIEIASSVRIGITKNPEPLWRFYVPGSRWVSGPVRLRASSERSQTPT
jgi:DNA-3-methyladenine glycosylase